MADQTGERNGEPNGGPAGGRPHGNPAGDRDGAEGASGDPRLTAPPDAAQQPRLPFPVVGVGASAGGLEAYTELLQAAPPDAGVAWVFIQHLPPDRESMVADILGKKTAMPVLQVEDGMPVRPDHVYVIRPGHTLTLKGGRLRLGAELAARGHGRPVDDFFRSLAEEQQQRAVAVVLSGMGSNGTAGAQAVKAVGGLVIAQEPETAKFPSMPRHLIDCHLADYVLRTAEIPDAIVRYARHPYTAGDPAASRLNRRVGQALHEILSVVRTRTRQDFTGYRKPTILRRVERRMGLGQFADMGEYAKSLRQNPGEVTALADDLLIHVTGFFRDPEVWDALREKVIAPLVAGRADGDAVRAWVAACATGDEAYSLAMLLDEAAEAAGKRLDIKVFATDMAERALGLARAGVFPNGIESEITPERLARFFDKTDGVYRVKKPLRELVVFAPQNVLQDPPFSRLDIVTCRNFLIYLEPDVQRRVLALMHFGLREGGTLVLGTSETAAASDGEFEPIDKKHRLYRRVGPTRHGAAPFAAPHGERAAPPKPAAPRLPVAQAAARALLDQFTPPAVVTDRDGDILHFHGDTGRFIDQPRGEPSRNLLVLANDQVRGAVRTALARAAAQGGPASVRDGLLHTPDGVRRLEVRVAPLDRRADPPLYLVAFVDAAERPPADPAAPTDEGRLVEELQRTRDELQGAVEELQTSNEELKASHEEMTSINEELQSTNEELETSKEEMQSLNEELTTVNAQLEAKMDELERTGSVLSSLLSSTDLAVLFLDRQLRIRRFTPAVKSQLDLISTDVGRPLTHLRWKFTDAALTADAQAVLERLIPVEKEVRGEDGREYLRRITPYRTGDDRIDGVVVTFVDVSAQRRADEVIRTSELRLQRMVNVPLVGVLTFDHAGALLHANDAFLEMVGYERPEFESKARTWRDFTPPEYVAASERVMEQLRATGRGGPYEKEYFRKDGSRRWMMFVAADLGDGSIVEYALDIGDRRRAEAELRASEGRLRAVAANLPGGAAFVVGHDLRYAVAGGDALAAAGFAPADFEGKTLAEALPPGTAAGYEQLYRRALGGEPFRLEHEDHGRHYVTHGTPLRDVAGAVTSALAVSYDISDRVRTEAALHASEERLRLALTAARMGIWTLDADTGTHVRDANLNALLGLDPAETAQPFARFLALVHPDDRSHVQEAFDRSIRDHQPLNIEFRVVRPDGAVRWLRDQGDVFHTAGARLLAGACVDITEMKEAAAAVRASEEQLRQIVESATDYAILTIDPDRAVTSWSPGAAATFGYAEADILGRPMDVLFTPEDRAAGAPRQEADTARRDGRAADERWHLRKDGTRFYASGVLTPLGGGDRGFAKVARDLTERKRMEEELERRVVVRTGELGAAVDALETEMGRRRELAGRLGTAAEEERRRVARDLHDTLGQLQTGLGLALSAARRTPKLPAAAGERLAEVQRLVDELARETHALAVRLRPTALDDLGLHAALGQLLTEWARRSKADGGKGAVYELEVSGIERGRLPPDVETALYRVVQEALTNVARHARCKRVSVVVERTDGHAVAVVEDDGVGFDPDSNGHGRLGLFGMKERAALAGGTLEVESAPGQGTTVIARIPVSHDRQPPDRHPPEDDR